MCGEPRGKWKYKVGKVSSTVVRSIEMKKKLRSGSKGYVVIGVF